MGTEPEYSTLIYNVANLSGHQWTGYRLHDGKLVDAKHPSYMELTQMYYRHTRVYHMYLRRKEAIIENPIRHQQKGWL